MSGRLEGKVAFVTGAARGQGRSHALRLAEEGADIIAIDICESIDGIPFELSTPADLDETVGLIEKLGRRVIATQTDVRDFDAVKAAVDSGVEQLGRLDVVAANAGIGGQGAPMHKLKEDSWRDMMDVNLTGVWHTTKAATPHILAGKRGGSIILTSSVGGLKAYPNVGHYVAAKHGVIGIMRTMAMELGPRNVRVNAVCPSQVNTPMVMNDATFKLFRPDLENPTVDDFAPISAQAHFLPIPWVEAVDVSNAVVFLASDEARYITGVALPIDAGSLLH